MLWTTNMKVWLPKLILLVRNSIKYKPQLLPPLCLLLQCPHSLAGRISSAICVVPLVIMGQLVRVLQSCAFQAYKNNPYIILDIRTILIFPTEATMCKILNHLHHSSSNHSSISNRFRDTNLRVLHNLLGTPDRLTTQRHHSRVIMTSQS